MIHYAYNHQVQPPAPFVHVTLRCVELLLGRDVLNRYRVLLDGPQLTLEIG